MESTGHEKHDPIPWISASLVVTFLVNAGFQVAFGFKMISDEGRALSVILMATCGAWILGMAVVLGLHARKRWAWFLAMLVFSACSVGGTGWMIVHLVRTPLWSLIGLAVVALFWILPGLHLYRIRHWYLPHVPEE